jgi:hypothetical protein
VGTWLADMRSRSLAARSILLGSVVAVLYGLVAPIAFSLGGTTALVAAGAAAGLCLLGAGLALVISHSLRKPKYALYGVLLGTAVRTGIPLGLGLTLFTLGGTLVQAGLMYYLLVFYLVTLGVETFLSLPAHT